MIYIKTRMQRMPECCEKCPYFKILEPLYYCPLPQYVCHADRMYFSGSIYSVDKERPSWCPLGKMEDGNGHAVNI